MNKSHYRSQNTGLPVVKHHTFRKMVSVLDSLLSLDFRHLGLQIAVDNESLSADLSVPGIGFRKRTLTFQVAADGSLLVLGNGHADNLSNLNVPEISMLIGNFVDSASADIN